MDKKAIVMYMLPTEDSLQIQRHMQTESEEMEKDLSCKRKEKKKRLRLAILQSDKIDYKIKTVTRDKENKYNNVL